MYTNENWHEPRQGAGDGELCARCPTCDRRYFKLTKIGWRYYCERCLDWAEDDAKQDAQSAAKHFVDD